MFKKKKKKRKHHQDNREQSISIWAIYIYIYLYTSSPSEVRRQQQLYKNPSTILLLQNYISKPIAGSPSKYPNIKSLHAIQNSIIKRGRKKDMNIKGKKTQPIKVSKYYILACDLFFEKKQKHPRDNPKRSI